MLRLVMRRRSAARRIVSDVALTMSVSNNRSTSFEGSKLQVDLHMYVTSP